MAEEQLLTAWIVSGALALASTFALAASAFRTNRDPAWARWLSLPIPLVALAVAWRGGKRFFPIAFLALWAIYVLLRILP